MEFPALWTRAVATVFASLILASADAARAKDDTRIGIRDFVGFYVATKPLRRERQKLPDSVYKIEAVDGVYVRLVWRAVEPRAGKYDWSTLDREVKRALTANKKISIGVRSGFFAPEWLYAKGVSKNDFYVGPHGGTRGRCESISIPSPWDPLYQEAFGAMMTALAQHLRATPGAYEAVRIVKLTGINQRTDELRLPAAPARAGSCQRDALATWRKAGYRPSKVIEAWEKLATSTSTAFPDKLLAINVLQTNDFPPIDEQGEVVTRDSANYVDVKGAIVTAGLQRFSGRFAVQWNGLSALKVAPAVLDARDRGAIIGWQTNQYKGFDGSGCDSNNVVEAQPCTGPSYRAILEFGIANGGRYIEIWPANAEQFPGEIKAARQKLN